MAIKKRPTLRFRFLVPPDLVSSSVQPLFTTNGLALTKNTIHRNKLSYTTDGKRIIITDRSF